MFWAAAGLVVFNLGKASLLLREVGRLWPVREEARAIAAALDVPDIPRYALKMMVAQAMGVMTLSLLALRFLALGEALHHPGPVLAGLHQSLAWVWDFYLAMARVLF